MKYKPDKLKIYGISQNPDTKDYIMVIQDGYCENGGEKYTNIITKWCRSCQTSGNEKIDGFIQNKQSEVDIFHFILEWIPYNKFNDIKKIGKDGPDTVYSAIWKDGP